MGLYVVLAPKENNSVRVTVDMCHVNKAVQDTHIPIPKIEHINLASVPIWYPQKTWYSCVYRRCKIGKLATEKLILNEIVNAARRECSHLIPPVNTKKPVVFLCSLVFSGGIKWEHWPGMCSNKDERK